MISVVTKRRGGERPRLPIAPSAAGFTLIEVMIALLIFGLLAAAGVALLTFSVRAQAATAAKLEDIGAIGRLSSGLSADLAQAIDRPSRDSDGAENPPFFGAHDADSEPMLAFVRGGWTNLDDTARPSAQKVAYRVEQGRLERIAYPLLDGAAALPPAVLLTGVNRVTLRYRHAGAWTDNWEGRAEAPLPDAVELTIARPGGADVRLLLLVGTGYAPPLQPGEAPDAPG